ncbi:MAG: hypothetical protein ACWGMZ_09995 [Thermoguttaceae bacterium]
MKRAYSGNFRHAKLYWHILGILLLSTSLSSMAMAVPMDFPGPSPGKAAASASPERCTLENALISMSWKTSGGKLRPGAIVDLIDKKTVSLGKEAFSIVLSDGRVLRASDFRLLMSPQVEDISARARALRIAERCAGKRIVATLVSPGGSLRVQWQAVLRDGGNYVRQELVLRAMGKELPLTEIVLMELPVDGAKTVGVAPGSPVVAGKLFFACENPLAENREQQGKVRCSLTWKTVLQGGKNLGCASVVGLAPAGQMRRAFLYYVERERVRPYQPFLHYNSWYDISWEDRKMDEKQCLALIDVFGREFVQKRGGRLDSFVFDDGWDDNKTLWLFHAGFPYGFTPLVDAAKKYRSGVGVWLSPWGGYAQAKVERLKFGRAQGFETNTNGFSLAGPKYYARFFDVCRRMIEKYDVNFFKFDGMGSGVESENRSDMMALLRLCKDLRALRPDLYISNTTGTWPSPYWLWYGDSIWRGGSDSDFCGKGSLRQQWMNYRDAITQQNVVRRAPLFPLNSVMNQGILYAQLGNGDRMDDNLKDVVDEFRMFFGCGTQLQELYMTPQMMSSPMWDALAEGAKWSRENADVLVDTHWIGGDAGKGEPYGYASWSLRKGILCVRNPNNKPQNLTLKLSEAFELPQNAPQQYSLKSPWKSDSDVPAQKVDASKEYCIALQPFEVRVLEATPQDSTTQ